MQTSQLVLQKGKSQWRRANAQLARHCQACALSSFTTQSSTVQKPHAELRRVAGVRRPLLRALQPPHAPTPHLLVALGYLAVLSVEPQGGM